MPEVMRIWRIHGVGDGRARRGNLSWQFSRDKPHENENKKMCQAHSQVMFKSAHAIIRLKSVPTQKKKTGFDPCAPASDPPMFSMCGLMYYFRIRL